MKNKELRFVVEYELMDQKGATIEHNRIEKTRFVDAFKVWRTQVTKAKASNAARIKASFRKIENGDTATIAIYGR